jgi:uncharacterized glyoxalase superfamily protein PhnB
LPPSYKPEHYNTVSPYLIVHDASNTIAFLTHVFGAVELRRFATADGLIAHAEVRIDDTIVMLADGTAEWRSTPSNVHIYVADVDATYQRAIEAGAISVQEPIKKDDADKRSGIKDVGGTIWWIATKLE